MPPRSGSVGLVLCALVAASNRAAADETAAAPAPPPPKICLQPLGRHDAGLLAVGVTGIGYLYGYPVAVLPRRALPRSAWYRPRRRYRAEKLLAFLDSDVRPAAAPPGPRGREAHRARKQCALVVGFTAVDISTTKGDHDDWGVLGLADIAGSAAMVSTFRMGRKSRSRRQTARRTVNVVNHELGHALGLEHDAAPGCIMNDAEGTVLTVDTEDGLLCADSRRLVEQRFGPLPQRPSFDWDAVLANVR